MRMDTVMQKQERKTQEREGKRSKQEQQQSGVRNRLNPRLVFTDPNSFFRDLLMEQQEQQ